jgi:hypothetical protein
MKRRADGPVEPTMIEPDSVPDYKKKLSKAEKAIWEEEYNIWKEKIPATSSMNSFSVELGELSPDDILAIRSVMDDEDFDIDVTKGYRAYFPVRKLSVKCPPQGLLLDDVAEKVLRIIGQGTGYLRLKNQDILLVTLDENDGIMRYAKHQQRHQQLGHLDVINAVKGIPEAAKLLLTVFVSLNKRSEPSFYGDMSLARLRSGVDSFTTPQAKNDWLLRQLEFAHTLTFEKQKVLNEEAALRGEWPSCETGTCYAFDPQKEYHAGQPKLRSSKGPELLLILQFALAPMAEFWDSRLNTGEGFGQHAWTAQMAESMLSRADDGTVDLMDTVSLDNLNTLSSMLQAQGIPYGILVEEDMRFERTQLTSWNPCMTIGERVKWSGRMSQTTTRQWHVGVMRILNPRTSQKALKREEADASTNELDMNEIVMHYLRYPGRIFAVRFCTSDDGRPWHHPTCTSLERRGKNAPLNGKFFEFRELMSEGHPGVPSYMRVWEGLARKECCGWMWKHSFALWAGCEQSYPKVLRLMTANAGHLNMYDRIVKMFEYWYTTSATPLQPEGGQIETKWLDIYWGDFFQPRLFTTLCATLQIAHSSPILPSDAKEAEVCLKWAGSTDTNERPQIMDTPGNFLFDDFVGKVLLVKRSWGEAYKRGKTKEFRVGHTHKWLDSHLGAPGRFVWAYAQNHMDFFFPDASMTECYGCFDGVGIFLEAFNTNEEWARGFYTADGIDDTGREGFIAFVLKEYADRPKSKCVWFSPQHTRAMHASSRGSDEFKESV